MTKFFDTPFPFHQIINRSGPIPKLDLDESIRSHIQSLILMRTGEFTYDRTMGFVIWDYDKEVFYHEREPYYEKKRKERGLLENANAQQYFKDNLKNLLHKYELRMDFTSINFRFEKVEGNLSVYQRKIAIEVGGRIKSTGQMLSPPFNMRILFTPFVVDVSG